MDVYLCKCKTKLNVLQQKHTGRGSVVGIATHHELDCPGIGSCWGRDFQHLSRPALGPTQPPVQWVQYPLYIVQTRIWEITTVRTSNVTWNYSTILFLCHSWMALQNVVVFHLAWSAVCHNCSPPPRNNGQQETVKHIPLTLTVHCDLYLLWSHPLCVQLRFLLTWSSKCSGKLSHIDW
jgi:hypothetical protein